MLYTFINAVADEIYVSFHWCFWVFCAYLLLRYVSNFFIFCCSFTNRNAIEQKRLQDWHSTIFIMTVMTAKDQTTADFPVKPNLKAIATESLKLLVRAWGLSWFAAFSFNPLQFVYCFGYPAKTTNFMSYIDFFRNSTLKDGGWTNVY